MILPAFNTISGKGCLAVRAMLAYWNKLTKINFLWTRPTTPFVPASTPSLFGLDARPLARLKGGLLHFFQPLVKLLPLCLQTNNDLLRIIQLRLKTNLFCQNFY